MEPFSGTVVINDVDTLKIGLRDLRSKLSIIPQDPVLFTGTIRSNLDPFNEYQDVDIWNALEGVNLKPSLSKLAEGLEAKVDSNGENFSSGQRQLLCLARAMLRKPKILVMDEATANVDMQSDQLIQDCLRKNFCNSSIITIAHRLNTVIDYDRILVLKDGNVVEYDAPHVLLQKSNGVFASMVDDGGESASQLLRKLAKQKYEGHKAFGEISPPVELPSE